MSSIGRETIFGTVAGLSLIFSGCGGNLEPAPVQGVPPIIAVQPSPDHQISYPTPVEESDLALPMVTQRENYEIAAKILEKHGYFLLSKKLLGSSPFLTDNFPEGQHTSVGLTPSQTYQFAYFNNLVKAATALGAIQEEGFSPFSIFGPVEGVGSPENPLYRSPDGDLSFILLETLQGPLEIGEIYTFESEGDNLIIRTPKAVYDIDLENNRGDMFVNGDKDIDPDLLRYLKSSYQIYSRGYIVYDLTPGSNPEGKFKLIPTIPVKFEPEDYQVWRRLNGLSSDINDWRLAYWLKNHNLRLDRERGLVSIDR